MTAREKLLEKLKNLTLKKNRIGNAFGRAWIHEKSRERVA